MVISVAVLDFNTRFKMYMNARCDCSWKLDPRLCVRRNESGCAKFCTAMISSRHCSAVTQEKQEEKGPLATFPRSTFCGAGMFENVPLAGPWF